MHITFTHIAEESGKPRDALYTTRLSFLFFTRCPLIKPIFQSFILVQMYEESLKCSYLIFMCFSYLNILIQLILEA